jgi:hypothetical protein
VSWKKWLKRTALLVGAYLILQTLWLVGERQWRWSKGSREVAQAHAETAVIDPDWNWEALSAKRRIPPPEKNGAELISRITAQLPRDWLDRLNPKKWEPDPVPQEPNTQYPADLIASMRKELVAARAVIEIARTYKDYPDGNRAIDLTPDVISTLLPDTGNTRLVAALLRWDTVLAVADGDKSRAANNLLALLNVSRSLGDEPFFISQLVRISSRMIAGRATEWVLAQTELSANQVEVLKLAWADDAEEPLLLNGVRGERATLDVLFRNLADGVVTGETLADGNPDRGISFSAYAWWLYRARVPRERAAVHRYMTAAVAAARLPAHEQAAALAALQPPIEAEMVFSRLFLPAIQKVAGAYWRNLAESRCVVAALACERYRLKNGRWPDQLADTTGEFLASEPLDPFDGQPLRYRLHPDGVVIYSIGQDLVDDNGNIRRTPVSEPGTDEGFRLWNPSERGKPAPKAGRSTDGS